MILWLFVIWCCFCWFWLVVCCFVGLSLITLLDWVVALDFVRFVIFGWRFGDLLG